MQNNAIVFNRDRFLKHYESNDMLDLGIKDFEQFSDQGMDHISRDMIKRDISKLKSVVQKCNEYVNTRIAHQSAKLISGRADQSEIPTVTDIDECIDYLEELLGKYYLLFHAATFATIVPKFQYDWKAIFRKTWIRE